MGTFLLFLYSEKTKACAFEVLKISTVSRPEGFGGKNGGGIGEGWIEKSRILFTPIYF